MKNRWAQIFSVLCLNIVLFFKQNQIILNNMTLPKFEKNTFENTEATPG